MFSSTSLILFGVIALIAVVVIWKWWKSPAAPPSKKDDDIESEDQKLITENSSPPPQAQQDTAPPPMVFAVNDGGNLDLADMSGKILNIGYGPNPKTYIGLLDAAEKDTAKLEQGSQIQFESKVGNTKLYEVAGRPYIINYTRLQPL